MGNSSGESIGGIIWFWHFGKSEMKLNHFLHLFLIGATVTSHGFLNFVWRVFKGGKIVLLTDKQSDTSGLGNRYTCGDIFGKEEFFNTNAVRLV